MTVQDLLLSILSSAAFSGLLVALVLWLSRAWLSERLKGSIAHEYAQKLDIYKAQLLAENQIALTHVQAEMEKEAAIRSAAQSASSEGQRVAMDRRLNAIDRIWKAILALRNNSPYLITFLDVLTIDEYKDLAKNDRFRELAGELSEERIGAMIPDASIEESRPYIGERMWSLFFAYQAVTLRVLFLMQRAYVRQAGGNWFDDPGIRQLLSVTLSKDELQQFDGAEYGKLNLLRRSSSHRLSCRQAG